MTKEETKYCEECKHCKKIQKILAEDYKVFCGVNYSTHYEAIVYCKNKKIKKKR